MTMSRVLPLLLLLIFAALPACGQGPSNPASAPLFLDRTIPLKGVQGRIDHLALDINHRRLFVAAFGNGSVEAVALDDGKVVGRIRGLDEPQGLAWLADREELAVASGDGFLRFYRGADLTLAGEIRLGSDADNVRIDPSSGNLIVGYGGGALAVVEAASRRVVATIPLPAHPESFQIDPMGRRVFVNLPGANLIAVADLASGRLIETRKADHRFNYPMLLEAETGTLLVVYRSPARLVATRADEDRVIQDIAACGDADDLFIDPKRIRLYISCGSGVIDVLDTATNGFKPLAQVKSASGARTSLFVPDLDRLFVAAPASAGKPAAILVFRPQD